MKRLLTIVITLILILSFAACNSPSTESSPLVETDPTGTYFDCTIEEYISLVNSFMTTSDLKGISFSAEPNTNKQYVADKTAYLKFTTNNDGKLTSIALHWSYLNSATDEDALAAGAVLGLIPNIFGLGDINIAAEFGIGNSQHTPGVKPFPPIQANFVYLNGRCSMTITPLFVSSQ